MPKTCLECFHLRTKIPVTGKGHLFAQKLCFNSAVCWCREDHLLVTNPPGSAPRTRYFKNVFKLPHSVRLAFTAAEHCPDFNGEEEGDATIPCNTELERRDPRKLYNSKKPFTSSEFFSREVSKNTWSATQECVAKIP